MADKSHSVSTAGPSDREDLGGTSVSVSARRTTVVAVLVVGATVFAVAIAAVLSGAGASSPEIESSVINEDSPSHRVFFENQRGQMEYNLETGSQTVYAPQYHFVTVTKHRADILVDEIAERIGEIASDIFEDFGVSIQSVNGGSDHVHILFTAKPTTDLTKFINSVKSVTSRKICDENPEVRQALDSAFWQPGYFHTTTTGQVSIDVLIEYVEDQ